MVLAALPGQNQLMYKIIGADGREYGPITADQLREWIAEGRANAQTRAQAEGSAQWKPLTEYLEFAPALGRTPPPVSVPGPIYLAPPRRTNSLALMGMVMGIFAITCGMCCC
jgi:GYF domain 2